VTRLIAHLLLRRLVGGVFLVFAVVTLTFFVIRLAPGDPAFILAGESPTPEFLAQVRAENGLDKPLPQQFATFLRHAATGDFGQSIYAHRPVFAVILERVPATALLAGTAMILASVLGVLLGVAAAKRAGTSGDAAISALSLLGTSVPSFWIGQLLVLLFAVWLGWLPVSGMVNARARYTGLYHVWDVATHMVLPVTTLAIYLVTLIARFTRTAMIEAMSQDFILVTRAKGVSARAILWHHAFRNAVVTTVTVIGLEFGAVLAGAVVVEIVFGWPGLGRLFYDAIYRRDFPLLTGSFMFSALVVIAMNTASEIVCALLDPRLRTA
jgi:peptide/nickel transport system permease protein